MARGVSYMVSSCREGFSKGKADKNLMSLPFSKIWIKQVKVWGDGLFTLVPLETLKTGPWKIDF